MKPSSAPGALGGEQVEGRHAVHELFALGRRRSKRVWVSEGWESAEPLRRIVALARQRDVPVQFKAADAVMAAARTSSPQGVIAWAAPVTSVSLDQLLAVGRSTGSHFLLVLDGVTDPGNFGAVLRSAACAGVGGVVVGRHRSAPLTPAAVKAAAGAVEVVPIAQVPGVPGALQALARAGVWAVGLDPAGPEELWHAPLLDGPVALVLGSEGAGLSQLARRRCDALVRVPQSGALGSLNVAAAAAVACFEVARRRAGAGRAEAAGRA